MCGILAFASFGVMVQTAHLGGQIRHSEIRNGAVVSTENDTGENVYDEKSKTQREKDDD